MHVSPERTRNAGRGGVSPRRVALARTLVKPAHVKAFALFRATFGVAPLAAASSPGRVLHSGDHAYDTSGWSAPVGVLRAASAQPEAQRGATRGSDSERRRFVLSGVQSGEIG